MKKLLVILAALMFAATAGAADLQLSGDYMIRGSYIDNGGTKADGKSDYKYYNQDMNVKAKLAVDDTTWINTSIAVFDSNWIGSGTSSSATPELNLERVWLTHKFSDMLTLDAGVMDGGTWGTTFGDNKSERQRIKFTATTQYGLIAGLIEKMSDPAAQAGNSSLEGNEWDDYAVGYVGKFGDIYVKPLIYVLHPDSYPYTPTYGKTKPWVYLMLALNGTIDNYGFEAEYFSQNQKYDDSDYDAKLYGFYVNGWMNVDTFKVGLIYAYGSTDTNKKGTESGFDFADDFDLTLYLSDWIAFGNTTGLNDNGMTGMSAIQVYVTDNISDKLSGTLSYTNVRSNWDTGNYKDAKAYEIDGFVNYKITDALSYNVGAAYAKIDYDSSSSLTDPDTCVRAYHKLSLSF